MSENLGNSAGNGARGQRVTGRKRKAARGISGQKNTKRGRVIELDEERTLEIEIVDDLGMGKKETTKLLVRASSWREVFQIKVDGLKLTEMNLDRDYEGVWKNRDRFCLDSDDFVGRFEQFANAPENMRTEETQKSVRDIENCMISLSTKQAEKDAIVNVLDKNLEMFEKERSKSPDGGDTPESQRLEAWIIGTCMQCDELENEIMEKKEQISEKNEDLMKTTGTTKNNLFSFVSLDDVKKFSPFTTSKKCSLPNSPPQ